MLFIAEAVTLAHVARAHTLASTLEPAAYDVHAAWDPRYNQLLGHLPYAFHPISSLSSQEFLRRLAKGAPMHDTATLRGYVRDDLDLIESVRPDVVVGDFRLSLAVSARKSGVKHVAVANAYWSPHGTQTFLFPEYDYPLSRLVGRSAARSAFRLLRPIGFAAHTRPLNVVCREHGLAGIGHDIRVMYTFGDYTAYADVPELVPLQNLPANHRYVGAVLWSPAVRKPEWWDRLPDDRPIVYVTPGSSGESDFLSVVLDGLAALPVTVIAATAGRTRVERPPKNAWIADYLPGIEAAARSALVICNGGSPTTYQALAAGVPVLGIAGNNMDQHLNMTMVQAAGAGTTLGAMRLTGNAVRKAADRLLGESAARERARHLQGAVRKLAAGQELNRLLGLSCE